MFLEIIEEEAKIIANHEQPNQENVLNVLQLVCQEKIRIQAQD